MFAKHKTSFVLGIVALLVYLILGLVLPELAYSPEIQTEAGWNVVQAVQALLETAAPFIALFILALAVFAYFRELK